MEPAYAVSTGFGTDETKFSIPRVTNHNIQMENKRKESLQNPNLILSEQDFYLLQRKKDTNQHVEMQVSPSNQELTEENFTSSKLLEENVPNGRQRREENIGYDCLEAG